ncbi:MAG: hypothetical protein R3C40_03920 [Parvularculaceae bacterium]|nr:folate-binding protein YgfZ [Parvularculaceae bacterium]
MDGILTSRAVARITGADSRAFLQGLVTSDVLHAEPGSAVFTTLLTPQGKVLFDFFLAPVENGFLIDCRASAIEALVKRLTLYKLRARLTVELMPGLGVYLGKRDSGAPAETSYGDPRLAELPSRMIAPRTDDAPSADDYYAERRRKLGVAEFGEDFDGEEVFLLDVNYDALNGVSYQKGCFVGQEVTSRMKRKGEIRKRTLIAAYSGAPPEKSTPLLAGETEIGRILSAGAGTALALVRIDRMREALDAGATVIAGQAVAHLSFPPYLKTA